MRTFALQWSLHGMYATGGAQRYYVSPSQINMGDWPKRMSCLPRCFVEEFCQLCENKLRWRKWSENSKLTGICMLLRLLKWIPGENSWKFISWDSITNTMSGVSTIIKGITFPSFAWKKCFSPRKVRWRTEATLTGSCIVAWFLQYLLNYVCKSRFSGLFFGLWNGINQKAAGINRINEELLNIRKYRNRTVWKYN